MGRSVVEAMDEYLNFWRERITHKYTKEEVDRLFDAIERSVISHAAIDMDGIKSILRPGDMSIVGFGNNASYDVLFEISGLRWMYEGGLYRAWISPRFRSRGLPGVEWYVQITVSETGTAPRASWSRTHMLRPQYRWYGMLQLVDDDAAD